MRNWELLSCNRTQFFDAPDTDVSEWVDAHVASPKLRGRVGVDRQSGAGRSHSGGQPVSGGCCLLFCVVAVFRFVVELGRASNTQDEFVRK